MVSAASRSGIELHSLRNLLQIVDVHVLSYLGAVRGDSILAEMYKWSGCRGLRRILYSMVACIISLLYLIGRTFVSEWMFTVGVQFGVPRTSFKCFGSLEDVFVDSC